MVAIAFKLAHPKRVATLVLENQRDNVGVAEHKRQVKDNRQFSILWMSLAPLGFTTPMSAIDTLEGRVFILWPHQAKGKPNNTMAATYIPKTIVQKSIRHAQVVDSFGLSDSEYAAILRTAIRPKARAKAKGARGQKKSNMRKTRPEARKTR